MDVVVVVSFCLYILLILFTYLYGIYLLASEQSEQAPISSAQ